MRPMQADGIYHTPRPVLESVTLTMTVEQAKLLHKFVAGTTSNSVIEATNLEYGKDDNEIYAINDVLFDIYKSLHNIEDLGLPSSYII